MTEKSTDTSEKKEPIGQWFNGIHQVASVVFPEQRPQLIVLTPILVFCLLLIFTSDFSDGVKVLLTVIGSVGFLWLAFSVLPKQAKVVESKQKEIDQISQKKHSLEREQSSLNAQYQETKSRLSKSISSAYRYLENIENKIAIIEEHTQEEHTKDGLTEIHHYVSAKKREFDSALARVSSGSDMIESKQEAGADLLADFRALQTESREASEQVSRNVS